MVYSEVDLMGSISIDGQMCAPLTPPSSPPMHKETKVSTVYCHLFIFKCSLIHAFVN